MQNYFILLGLSFDPPETNEEIINNAINEKVKQWQNESKNPRKAMIAKDNMSKIPDIKKVMLDEKLREQEAQAAKQYKKDKIKDISYEILILSTKGYILLDEIENILKKYKEYCLKREDIEFLFNVPVIEKKTEGSQLEVLDSNIISQLETYFKNLSCDDMSLYTLLNIPPAADKKNALRIINDYLNVLLQKGEKLNEDEIYQKLGGIAKTIFDSNENIKKYNNLLSGKRYLKLNEFIKNAANLNNNKITIETFNIISQIGINEYGMSEEEILNYVIANAAIDGIEIDADTLKNRKNPIILDINKSNLKDIEKNSPEQFSPDDNNNPFEENDPFESNDPFNNWPSETLDSPDSDEYEEDNIFDNIFDSRLMDLKNRCITPLAEIFNNNTPVLESFIEETMFYETQNREYNFYPEPIIESFFAIECSIITLLNMILSLQYEFLFSQMILMCIFIITIFAVAEATITFIKISRYKTIQKNIELLHSYIQLYNEIIEEDFNLHEINYDEFQENPQSEYDYYNNLSKKGDFICNKMFLLKNKTVKMMKSFRKTSKPIPHILLYKLLGLTLAEVIIIYIVFFL